MPEPESTPRGQGGPARTLVASFCFPPYSDTAAIVAAKRVRDAGEPVDVIYNAMDSERRTDPSLLAIAGDLVRRHTALPTPTMFAKWESVVPFQQQGLEVALQWEELNGGAYERLYSRAHFAASHYLAARYKIVRPGVRWAAEFSDPLSHDVLGNVRRTEMRNDQTMRLLRRAVEEAGYRPPSGTNTLEWAEVIAFALADEVVFTNPHQREVMLGLCHDPELAADVEARSTISPHPTLPRDLYHLVESDYALEPGLRHIGYFGNFYANRGVGSVLTALTMLPPHLRRRLRLHVFTNKPAELEAEAAKLGVGDTVVVGPYVDFLEFLNLATRMDCLLVNDAVTPGAEGPNPFLPSKISDYRGAGVPIWGITEEGSSIDRLPLTYRSPVEHVTAATQVLARIASRPSVG